MYPMSDVCGTIVSTKHQVGSFSAHSVSKFVVGHHFDTKMHMLGSAHALHSVLPRPCHTLDHGLGSLILSKLEGLHVNVEGASELMLIIL